MPKTEIHLQTQPLASTLLLEHVYTLKKTKKNDRGLPKTDMNLQTQPFSIYPFWLNMRITREKKKKNKRRKKDKQNAP